MDCKNFTERLVEHARRSSGLSLEPDAPLRAHLRSCAACLERWEAEQTLAAGLRAMRVGAAGMRSSDTRRDALMLRFAVTNSAAPNTEWPHGGWLWAAAAAVLLLAVTLGYGGLRKSKSAAATYANETVVEETGGSQIDPNEDGFIPVPYIPPLAAGEIVSVVHTELYPAALASLGVTVDPAWTTELPADLLVGQDGFPRAVRVSDDYSYTRGY